MVLTMKMCCCFCGKEIKDFPRYVLTVQKTKEEESSQEESSDVTSQTLFCHEKCFVEKLFDDKLLYLKYI